MNTCIEFDDQGNAATWLVPEGESCYAEMSIGDPSGFPGDGFERLSIRSGVPVGEPHKPAVARPAPAPPAHVSSAAEPPQGNPSSQRETASFGTPSAVPTRMSQTPVKPAKVQARTPDDGAVFQVQLPDIRNPLDANGPARGGGPHGMSEHHPNTSHAENSFLSLPTRVHSSEAHRLIDGAQAQRQGLSPSRPTPESSWALSDLADSYDEDAALALRVLHAYVGPTAGPATRAAAKLLQLDIEASQIAADLLRLGQEVGEHGWQGVPKDAARALTLAGVLGVPLRMLSVALGAEAGAARLYLKLRQGAKWAETFNSFTEETIRLDISMGRSGLYRAHDTQIAARLGKYASRERPATPAAAIRNNALNPDLTSRANHASRLYEVSTRPGFFVRGTVRAQGPGYPGGNTQIFSSGTNNSPWATLKEIDYVSPAPLPRETALQYLIRLKVDLIHALGDAKPPRRS